MFIVALFTSSKNRNNLNVYQWSTLRHLGGRGYFCDTAHGVEKAQDKTENGQECAELVMDSRGQTSDLSIRLWEITIQAYLNGRGMSKKWSLCQLFTQPLKRRP